MRRSTIPSFNRLESRVLKGEKPKMRRCAFAGVIAAIMAVSIAVPSSAAVQENDNVPLRDFQVSIPCNHNVVTLNGRLHVLSTFTRHGNHVSGKYHAQPKGLTGMDRRSRTYHGVGVTQGHFSGSLHNGQYTSTDINNFYIIGTGNAPTYKIHETLHLTFDAGGHLTASVDNFRITCG